jgi:hypothetical protein
MDNKKRSRAMTGLRRRHDAVLAARELADARSPHLHINLSLYLLSILAAGSVKTADSPQCTAGLIGTRQT